MKRVLILGATGVMGRHVLCAARRHLPGVRLVPASRHVAANAQQETRRVDIHDATSVRRGLQGIAAVINAVGPFDYDPAPLVRECLRAGCHYADLAETTPFLRAVEQSVAQDAGGLPGVLSGASTVPGLVQVLAQRWAGWEEVCRLRVFLSLGSANPVSPTMLYSLLRPLGRRAPDGSRYFSRLIRRSHRNAPPRLYGRYPSPFDAGGIVLGARTLPATFYTGMDRAGYGLGLWLAAHALPYLSAPALRRLCCLAQPLMPLLQRLGAARGMLSLEALDGQGRVIDEMEVRAESDGLVIPALPSVWAVRRFLAEAPSLPPPPLRLDTLFTPEQVIEWLLQEGYSVSGGEGHCDHPAPRVVMREGAS